LEDGRLFEAMQYINIKKESNKKYPPTVSALSTNKTTSNIPKVKCQNDVQ